MLEFSKFREYACFDYLSETARNQLKRLKSWVQSNVQRFKKENIEFIISL